MWEIEAEAVPFRAKWWKISELIIPRSWAKCPCSVEKIEVNCIDFASVEKVVCGSGIVVYGAAVGSVKEGVFALLSSFFHTAAW